MNQEDKDLRKIKGGLIEKRPHVPKMVWMKNRLQKNKSSSSSDLMDRVQTFLKQIAESNRQLEETAAKNPEAVNIENTDDCEDNVIEMNLAMVPVDRDSDSEESSDEDDSDDAVSVDAAGELQIEHKKRTGRLVQVLSADNQEMLDDDEEESNDVILQDDDDRVSIDSSDSESSAMKSRKLKEEQRGPLVEVISSFADDDKLDDVNDALQDEKQELDDLSNHDSDFTVDKFLSSQNKERVGPLIEVLNPEDTTR